MEIIVVNPIGIILAREGITNANNQDDESILLTGDGLMVVALLEWEVVFFQS